MPKMPEPSHIAKLAFCSLAKNDFKEAEHLLEWAKVWPAGQHNYAYAMAIICYARPFMKSGIEHGHQRWSLPKPDEPLKCAHDKIMAIRDKVVAHKDISVLDAKVDFNPDGSYGVGSLKPFITLPNAAVYDLDSNGIHTRDLLSVSEFKRCLDEGFRTAHREEQKLNKLIDTPGGHDGVDKT